MQTKQMVACTRMLGHIIMGSRVAFPKAAPIFSVSLVLTAKERQYHDNGNPKCAKQLWTV